MSAAAFKTLGLSCFKVPDDFTSPLKSEKELLEEAGISLESFEFAVEGLISAFTRYRARLYAESPQKAVNFVDHEMREIENQWTMFLYGKFPERKERLFKHAIFDKAAQKRIRGN
jgi:hypothetical protein